VKAHEDAHATKSLSLLQFLRCPLVSRFLPSLPPPSLSLSLFLSLYLRACESQSVFASRSKTGGGGGGGGGGGTDGTESIVFPRPYFYITSLPVRVNVHRMSVWYPRTL